MLYVVEVNEEWKSVEERTNVDLKQHAWIINALLLIAVMWFRF